MNQILRRYARRSALTLGHLQGINEIRDIPRLHSKENSKNFQKGVGKERFPGGLDAGEWRLRQILEAGESNVVKK